MQKRFVFDQPKSEWSYLPPSLDPSLTIILPPSPLPTDKWREYPVSLTAYTYFFGAMFMGFASISYYNQPQVFYLPKQASRTCYYKTETLEWLKQLCVCLSVTQTLYVLVYAIFITSALCYLLITWANMHISSIIVTASWPIQVHTCTCTYNV